MLCSSSFLQMYLAVISALDRFSYSVLFGLLLFSTTCRWCFHTDWCELIGGSKEEASFEVFSWHENNWLCRCWVVPYYMIAILQQKLQNIFFFLILSTARILLMRQWPANGRLSGWRYLPAGLALCCMCGLWLLRWFLQIVTLTKGAALLPREDGVRSTMSLKQTVFRIIV